MKKLVLAILFLLSNSFLFSQEGEGDIYMRNLVNETSEENSTTIEEEETILLYDAKTYVAPSSDTTIQSSERIIVDYLFTSLSFEDVKAKAKQEEKNYFIDFTAEWCSPCKMMEKTTFRDFLVVSYSQKHYYAVQLDITDFDAIELQAMYDIKSLPTILFFDYNGNLLDRALGFQTGTLFLEKLKEVHLSNLK